MILEDFKSCSLGGGYWSLRTQRSNLKICPNGLGRFSVIFFSQHTCIQKVRMSVLYSPYQKLGSLLGKITIGGAIYMYLHVILSIYPERERKNPVETMSCLA